MQIARAWLAAAAAFAGAFTAAFAGFGSFTFCFGTAPRIALLGDAFLFFLQGLVEITERIVEALFVGLTPFFGRLRATRTFRRRTAGIATTF